MSRKPWSPLLALSTIGAVTLLIGGPGAATCQELTDDQLWLQADQRIEKCRQADCVVAVVDATGNPVEGAGLAVRQRRHAFLFGSNIFGWGNQRDEAAETAYREHFAELLNFATLPFYWTGYEPRQGEPNHQRTEQVARWCKQQGIATKGHPLAWNMGDPRWLPDDLDEIRRLQMARIDDCVARFPGLIDRWDVVNEATHFDREEFANRRSPKLTAMWAAAGQMEFTRECFTHARAAGPESSLLINDYRVDPAYERVIEQLVDADGKPMYDVIGIQSHQHGGAWTNRKIWRTCERFARFGVPLHYTETTIISGEKGWMKSRETPWESTPEGEAEQAREVARFYTMLFSHPSVEAITWWDFSDYHAWQGAPAGFLREDMTPKPAYHALKSLVKGAWWTELTVETDAAGLAAFRGFLGDYSITVSVDGKKVEKPFSLERDAENRWVIKLDD